MVSLGSGRQMRIFNLDLHISVIADIKNILEGLGHSVVDWSISDSTAIMGRKKEQVDCICNERGRLEDWRNIGPEMANRFYGATGRNWLSSTPS